MKKLIYITLILAAAATGCAKTNNTPPTVPLPVGNFTGVFYRIHKNPTTAKFDTTMASLNLSLSASTGYVVTGDTATLHAGSYGGYAVNAYYIQFVDKTFSASAPFTKYHLSGVYNYNYNGTQLNIYVSYADTLGLEYVFKKNN